VIFDMDLAPLDNNTDHTKQISNVCVVKVYIVTLFIANAFQIGELAVHI
jgi:hypothetical protein